MHIPSYLAAFAELAALAAASPPSYGNAGKSGRQNPPGSGLQNFLVNYNVRSDPDRAQSTVTLTFPSSKPLRL